MALPQSTARSVSQKVKDKIAKQRTFDQVYADLVKYHEKAEKTKMILQATEDEELEAMQRLTVRDSPKLNAKEVSTRLYK